MGTNTQKEDFLDLLKKRTVVGDGSYAITLEKRGYVKAGFFTPECVLEYPEAVLQLHREYVRAGSDVIQAYTFYSTDGKLKTLQNGQQYTCEDLNQAACDLAKQIADPSGVLICGGVSPTPTYKEGKGKEAVQAEFRKQCDIYIKNKVDFLLGEFFDAVEEAEWAAEALKEYGLPVACTMRIGPTGDITDITPQDAAVRMAKAGADLVGLNCQYDPFICLKTIAMMKEGLEAAGLSPYLMIQPNGFMCPDAENLKQGSHDLPEYPFALEPRLITRFEMRDFAQKARELGVRYIGGCCGCEPYHIREVAEEVADERGYRPPGQDKYEPWGGSLKHSAIPEVAMKGIKDYWKNLKPASGRPDHPQMSGSYSADKTSTANGTS